MSSKIIDDSLNTAFHTSCFIILNALLFILQLHMRFIFNNSFFPTHFEYQKSGWCCDPLLRVDIWDGDGGWVSSR